MLVDQLVQLKQQQLTSSKQRQAELAAQVR
jgi:hypothetical protein